ncbi:hypothetical protein PCANC_02399 [Puccinia coronata f. sp. avenae]|uniref:Uncharacterized protein n=1 Tax=Puccinia coronata f. sp. avenae TaxID=200324 RepID=A0A2N5W4S4_9BASI|nr:hypothetical protein PCANC_02399 [Puccinia coronata f. sp. avenae]
MSPYVAVSATRQSSVPSIGKTSDLAPNVSTSPRGFSADTETSIENFPEQLTSQTNYNRQPQLAREHKPMIPPRLAHQLQNLITRKLLESSTFNEIVARTDGIFHSVRLGLKEGWEEGNRESAGHPRKSPDQDEEKTTPRNQSRTSSTDRSQTYSSASSAETYQQRKSETTEQEKRRLDTEQKLQELLEKLRRQQPKT